MSVITIEAKKREETGRRNNKKMRSNGVVPGVFYRAGEDAVSVVFDEKNLSQFLNHAHGLVDLKVEGEKSPLKCVLKEVQYHPVTERVLHVDFLGVNMSKTMRIMVPINLKGEARGVKLGGMLQQPLRELSIECFPEHLPDQIEIDITNLAIGKSIQVKDLNYENVRILNDPNDAIALVELTRGALSQIDSESEAAEPVESEESDESAE
ncbi:MAG: 50S ribosomal protein L25 [Calditrichaeota bacterium]|nr:50S ribosomal protein L25 [Calditrichota bacterium]